MNEKWKRYITGCMILLLIFVISFLPGCGSEAYVDSSQIIENSKSDDGSIEDEKVDIIQEEDKADTKERGIVDDSENLDTNRKNELDNAEVYELFMNGELTVEQKEERVTISELFWGNDIE